MPSGFDRGEAAGKAGIPVEDIRKTIDAWRAVLPIQAAEDGNLSAALEAVRVCNFGTQLFASARRVGVRCLFTEALQDGFILEVNPFAPTNDQLVDEVLPHR